MTPKQAAEIIGCSPQQVRTLIRAGRLKAKPVLNPLTGAGFVYDITKEEAQRVRDLANGSGWPRGRKRKQMQEYIVVKTNKRTGERQKRFINAESNADARAKLKTLNIDRSIWKVQLHRFKSA